MLESSSVLMLTIEEMVDADADLALDTLDTLDNAREANDADDASPVLAVRLSAAAPAAVIVVVAARSIERWNGLVAAASWVPESSLLERDLEAERLCL